VTGEVTLVANEVAIGLTMPLAAIEILRQRLTPAAFNRAVTIAATFSPEAALTAGILDEVVAPAELAAAAQAVATSFVALDMAAHAQSKLRARQATLDAIRAGIEAEFAPMRG
jgi:enoyl-CoA hydratase